MSNNKWLVILVSAIMAFGIFACEENKDDEETGNTVISGKIINLSGGESPTGDGGGGGLLFALGVGPSGVQFLKEGSANTSFNIPEYTQETTGGRLTPTIP